MYVQLTADAFVHGRTHLAGEVILLDDAIDQEFGTVLTEDGDSPQTAAQWTSDNPTMSDNNFGAESDTGKIKVGDGTTAWNDLEYATGTFAATPETLNDKLGKDFSKLPELTSEDLASVDWTATMIPIRVVTTDEEPVTTLYWVSPSVLTELITTIQND